MRGLLLLLWVDDPRFSNDACDVFMEVNPVGRGDQSIREVVSWKYSTSWVAIISYFPL